MYFQYNCKKSIDFLEEKFEETKQQCYLLEQELQTLLQVQQKLLFLLENKTEMNDFFDPDVTRRIDRIDPEILLSEYSFLLEANIPG